MAGKIKRKKGDVRLRLRRIPLLILDGPILEASAEGINAAWQCPCGYKYPVLGRAYFQFGMDCHSDCPGCERRYRVFRDAQKRASEVREIPTPLSLPIS